MKPANTRRAALGLAKHNTMQYVDRLLVVNLPNILVLSIHISQEIKQNLVS